MNVAAFNVAAMNIHHVIECSSPDSATFNIRFCLFRTRSLTLFTNSAASLPMTKFSSLRTLRNAHFRREEVLHDEGQLFAIYPKKFSQVSLIDRAPQLHFATLEKTKIDHNPLLNNLVVTVSQMIHRVFVLQRNFCLNFTENNRLTHQNLRFTRSILMALKFFT